MASEQMKAFLNAMKGQPKKKDNRPIEEQRAGLDELMSSQRIPDYVEIVDLELAGRPARRYLSNGARTDRGVLYLHGGGYTIGSLDAYNSLMAHLSVACQADVTGLDYRLAPEYTYPAALEDAVAAFEEMSESMAAEKIMIAGDSAGGGLALACMLKLKDEKSRLPGCATLISPWTDLTCSGESLGRERETYVEGALPYIGDFPPETVGISPLFGEFEGLPPLLIQVASDEAMLDDSTRLEARARAADVSVDIRLFDEAFHVFQVFTDLPEAQEALSEIGSFFDLHILPRQGAAC
jgi:acetyl esterase/lipase